MNRKYGSLFQDWEVGLAGDVKGFSSLKEKFSKVFQKFTPEQKKLCRLIKKKGLNLDGLDEFIYNKIVLIRKVFRKEGLEKKLNFFKKSIKNCQKNTNNY